MMAIVAWEGASQLSAHGTTQRGRNCPAWSMRSQRVGRRKLYSGHQAGAVRQQRSRNEIQPVARCRRRAAAEADSRPHLAGADRFWLHRSAAREPVPQADSDAARGPRIPLRLSVSLEAFVGNLQEPAWLRANYPARDARSASARYDRHTVFHLGARLGRISCLVAVTKIPPRAKVPSPRSRARTARCGRRRFAKQTHGFAKEQQRQANLRQVHLIARS